MSGRGNVNAAILYGLPNFSKKASPSDYFGGKTYEELLKPTITRDGNKYIVQIQGEILESMWRYTRRYQFCIDWPNPLGGVVSTQVMYLSDYGYILG